MKKPAFQWYLGIDYSGAATPETPLSGIRLYQASPATSPKEVRGTRGRGKHWSRRELAEYLRDHLLNNGPSLVGVDHGFSFPEAYFQKYSLRRDWDHFLDDWQYHWPTGEPGITVEKVRRGEVGSGFQRTGSARWRRLTEELVRAKSVFHFDVPGSVAKSTHAGLPWLWYLRRSLEKKVHFWPFDGWTVPEGCSVISEVYPSLWKGDFGAEARTPDQQDALAVASWLRETDRAGQMGAAFQPRMSTDEKELAKFEGWILGVCPAQ